MADTLTTNYQWIMPEDQASADTWGQKINGDLQAIDSVVFANAQTVSAQISPGSINWSNSAAPSGQQVRWSMDLLTTEAASNVGSDLAIHRFDNTGAPFPSGGAQGGSVPLLAAGTPVMVINRATGQATFNAQTTFAVGLDCQNGGPVNLDQATLQFRSADGTTKYGTISSILSSGQSGVIIQSSSSGSPTELIVGADSSSGQSGILTNRGLGFLGGTGYINWSFGTSVTSRIYWQAANPGSPGPIGSLSITNLGTTLTLDNAGNFTFNGTGGAFKPGGGAWAALSDARIKTVEGDYTHGLEQVLGLNPVVYRYKGNDGDKQPTDSLRVGLIAQAVEQVMPDMVTLCEGTIDGEPVSDLRRLDTSELIFALVNSVKELTARIRVLEAR